ncbi:MAG TPA: NADH-quinone oxidoreductase subunit N [Verrucomicrobiae bacterium]|nr:NADH-quinone oxidoreductase subunit N [Verrucomicrobiae bacterium]
MNYLELLRLVAPEAIVVITALVVLAVDLLVMREEPLRNRFRIGAVIAGFGCVVAAAWLLVMDQQVGALGGQGGFLTLVGGMFVADPLTRLVKVALLALTLCTIILSMEGNFTNHIGEYLSLILLATTGMMLLVSSTDLLMIFISLELTSLSLYILTAFNKRNIKSAEAALKYFLFGGMSAAFTLFGLSLIYGLSGSTNLNQIAAHLEIGRPRLDPLLLAAIVMTVIGFGFKIAVAPFHLWAPDAYQGAPTPSAALIASGSKVASFFILAKVMIVAFGQAGGSGAWHHYVAGWLPVLAILAALSMLIGNLAAIAQSNVKRLLAYSAIAHAGYALLGLLANNQQGLGSLVYYVVTYGLTVVGAFGVVMILETRTGDAKIADFAGLGRSEPLLSFCMLIFMLSLAGIPPLAGFFGKFYLFTAAVGGAKDLGLLWLVVFAIAMSAVSLYYYLQILKQIYVVPAPAGEQKIQVPVSSQIVLGLLALGVVLLGCLPNLLLGRLLASIQTAGF